MVYNYLTVQIFIYISKVLRTAWKNEVMKNISAMGREGKSNEPSSLLETKLNMSFLSGIVLSQIHERVGKRILWLELSPKQSALKVVPRIAISLVC